MIIADFRKTPALKAGTTNEDLISGIDLGVSSLALADVPIPNYMEGKIMECSFGSEGPTVLISMRLYFFWIALFS